MGLARVVKVHVSVLRGLHVVRQHIWSWRCGRNHGKVSLNLKYTLIGILMVSGMFDGF